MSNKKLLYIEDDSNWTQIINELLEEQVVLGNISPTGSCYYIKENETYSLTLEEIKEIYKYMLEKNRKYLETKENKNG